jgi:hypothetical protein
LQQAASEPGRTIRRAAVPVNDPAMPTKARSRTLPA